MQVCLKWKMTKNLTKNPDGSYAVIVYFNADERRALKKLARRLGVNDFEAVKYAIQLVEWWSKGKIEPEDA